jgi:DNA (cytosine-5)-methyltransferase 1
MGRAVHFQCKFTGDAAGTAPWPTVRDALHDLPPPVPRGAEPTVPNHVQHPGARVYPPWHLGSFYDYPAKALKAGTNGTPGGENLVHVPGAGGVRYFTTREAARLQTFPDTWLFHGTWGACIKQLGNAVPVARAERFAGEIRRRLEGARPGGVPGGAT